MLQTVSRTADPATRHANPCKFADCGVSRNCYTCVKRRPGGHVVGQAGLVCFRPGIAHGQFPFGLA